MSLQYRPITETPTVGAVTSDAKVFVNDGNNFLQVGLDA